MINYIFSFFIMIGIIYSFLSGNTTNVNKSIISSGMDAIKMIVNMIPLLCLWLGIMKVAEDSGLLKNLTKVFSKIIHPLFPELNRNGDSITYIASNIIMNMFGLGNAATPFGLLAMKSMQKENLKKDTASRSMITFLVINTASVTIIPTTVISIRALNHSNNPSEILLSSIIVTILSCFIGIILDRIIYHIWRDS